MENTKRICSTCNKELKTENKVQSGYYCCDEYYCSEDCLLAGNNLQTLDDWVKEHYSQSDDCYWTEWEL